MCTTCTYCDVQDKVETLRSECDDLRTRARSSEEALLRDSDVKVQVHLWYTWDTLMYSTLLFKYSIYYINQDDLVCYYLPQISEKDHQY